MTLVAEMDGSHVRCFLLMSCIKTPATPARPYKTQAFLGSPSHTHCRRACQVFEVEVSLSSSVPTGRKPHPNGSEALASDLLAWQFVPAFRI